MPRSLLVYNPAAGQWWRRPRPEVLLRALARRGWTAELLVTRGQDHATELVREHLAGDVEAVWACGGDGTVAQAAAALVGTEVPVGILPHGTVNVLALECGVPRDPLRAVEALAGLPGARRFQAWKSGARAVLLRVSGVDHHGNHFDLSATQVLATNPRRYAGRFPVAPDADPEDALLDVVLFRGDSRVRMAGFWLGVELPGALHLRVPGAAVLRARHLRVEAADGRAVEAHLNGDAVATTPLSVEPWGKVRLLAPEH
jgi:diacylglycerol kinase family enzyme